MPNLMVTITLDPSMYVFKSIVQYNRVKELVRDKFKKCKANYYLAFELTKKYNIHIHAYVIPAKDYKHPHYYFTNLFRAKKGEARIFGYTKVTNATDTKGAFDYINKDLTITSELLDIPITKVKMMNLTDSQAVTLDIEIPVINRLENSTVDNSHG